MCENSALAGAHKHTASSVACTPAIVPVFTSLRATPTSGGGATPLLTASSLRCALPASSTTPTSHQTPTSSSSTLPTSARRSEATSVSSFLFCLSTDLDAYWKCEHSFTEAFDHFLQRQFAPGLTRLLLQQRCGRTLPEGARRGGSDDQKSRSTSCVANDNGDCMSDCDGDLAWLADDDDLAGVSYVSLAAEVSRLQSVFVTSVLAEIDAERQLRTGRAMYQRALVLQQDHSRVAGWTRSQVCRHIEQCRQDTTSLLAAADASYNQSLPELLVHLAPLVCARIVRKDNELKLQRQAYFLSKLELSVQWLQQQHSRLLLLAASLQAEHRYIDHSCRMLAHFQHLMQDGVSVSTSNAYHLQRLQRYLSIPSTSPAFVLAPHAPAAAVATCVLHPLVQRVVSLWDRHGATTSDECDHDAEAAAAIFRRGWHILEEDVYSHLVAQRQHLHQQQQQQRVALLAIGEQVSRGREHLMQDCAAATQATPCAFAWTPTSVAALLQRLEQESQLQSEAYRVLRQQDKERLLAFSDLSAESARCALPLDYEKHMWADFVSRPAELVALLQKLEQDRRYIK